MKLTKGIVSRELTKGIVSREEAVRMAPLYVEYAEGNFDKWGAMFDKFSKLRVGSLAITFIDGKFVRVKVSSIRSLPYDADGPCVRVSNGEASWRVDGNKYAYPMEKS